ncbi:MAG: ImmA/IrrE family metallo-endopeptidase, partial [Verrucomicrobia bacterium]|nr:ImmA/IrrE family metallo-endopeptidase [Verrucomicrobiota bacterium]
MIPKTLQEAICRKEANILLNEFLVGAPDEIDLETIAWKTGRLRVKSGELDTAEGRLVATDHEGVIRVKATISNKGRRRFTVAHEIGHYRLHKARSVCDTLKNLRTWK